MKSANIVKTILVVLVSVFCLIIWSGFSEVWAKGPGAKQGTTSRITQPGNTQGSPSASSGNQPQNKPIDKAYGHAVKGEHIKDGIITR